MIATVLPILIKSLMITGFVFVMMLVIEYVNVQTNGTWQNKLSDNIGKQYIFAAGTGLGWMMKEVEPGHIVATLALRSHIAKVDIKYDKKSYSITYKDSENLNYNGKSIHSNYNGWIQNLNRSIQAQLSNL